MNKLTKNKIAQGLGSFIVIIILLTSILASSIFYQASITPYAIYENSFDKKPSSFSVQNVNDVQDLSTLNEGWYNIKNGYVYYLEYFDSEVPLYIKVRNSKEQNGLLLVEEDGSIKFDESYKMSTESIFVDKDESSGNEVTGKVSGLEKMTGFQTASSTINQKVKGQFQKPSDVTFSGISMQDISNAEVTKSKYRYIKTLPNGMLIVEFDGDAINEPNNIVDGYDIINPTTKKIERSIYYKLVDEQLDRAKDFLTEDQNILVNSVSRLSRDYYYYTSPEVVPIIERAISIYDASRLIKLVIREQDTASNPEYQNIAADSLKKADDFKAKIAELIRSGKISEEDYKKIAGQISDEARKDQLVKEIIAQARTGVLTTNIDLDGTSVSATITRSTDTTIIIFTDKGQEVKILLPNQVADEIDWTKGFKTSQDSDYQLNRLEPKKIEGDATINIRNDKSFDNLIVTQNFQILFEIYQKQGYIDTTAFKKVGNLKVKDYIEDTFDDGRKLRIDYDEKDRAEQVTVTTKSGDEIFINSGLNQVLRNLPPDSLISLFERIDSEIGYRRLDFASLSETTKTSIAVTYTINSEDGTGRRVTFEVYTGQTTSRPIVEVDLGNGKYARTERISDNEFYYILDGKTYYVLDTPNGPATVFHNPITNKLESKTGEEVTITNDGRIKIGENLVPSSDLVESLIGVAKTQQAIRDAENKAAGEKKEALAQAEADFEAEFNNQIYSGSSPGEAQKKALDKAIAIIGSRDEELKQLLLTEEEQASLRAIKSPVTGFLPGIIANENDETSYVLTQKDNGEFIWKKTSGSDDKKDKSDTEMAILYTRDVVLSDSNKFVNFFTLQPANTFNVDILADAQGKLKARVGETDYDLEADKEGNYYFVDNTGTSNVITQPGIVHDFIENQFKATPQQPAPALVVTTKAAPTEEIKVPVVPAPTPAPAPAVASPIVVTLSIDCSLWRCFDKEYKLVDEAWVRIDKNPPKNPPEILSEAELYAKLSQQADTWSKFNSVTLKDESGKVIATLTPQDVQQGGIKIEINKLDSQRSQVPAPTIPFPAQASPILDFAKVDCTSLNQVQCNEELAKKEGYQVQVGDQLYYLSCDTNKNCVVKQEINWWPDPKQSEDDIRKLLEEKARLEQAVPATATTSLPTIKQSAPITPVPVKITAEEATVDNKPATAVGELFGENQISKSFFILNAEGNKLYLIPKGKVTEGYPVKVIDIGGGKVKLQSEDIGIFEIINSNQVPPGVKIEKAPQKGSEIEPQNNIILTGSQENRAETEGVQNVASGPFYGALQRDDDGSIFVLTKDPNVPGGYIYYNRETGETIDASTARQMVADNCADNCATGYKTAQGLTNIGFSNDDANRLSLLALQVTTVAAAQQIEEKQAAGVFEARVPSVAEGFAGPPVPISSTIQCPSGYSCTGNSQKFLQNNNLVDTCQQGTTCTPVPPNTAVLTATGQFIPLIPGSLPIPGQAGTPGVGGQTTPSGVKERFFSVDADGKATLVQILQTQGNIQTIKIGEGESAKNFETSSSLLSDVNLRNAFVILPSGVIQVITNTGDYRTIQPKAQDNSYSATTEIRAQNGQTLSKTVTTINSDGSTYSLKTENLNDPKQPKQVTEIYASADGKSQIQIKYENGQIGLTDNALVTINANGAISQTNGKVVTAIDSQTGSKAITNILLIEAAQAGIKADKFENNILGDLQGLHLKVQTDNVAFIVDGNNLLTEVKAKDGVKINYEGVTIGPDGLLVYGKAYSETKYDSKGITEYKNGNTIDGIKYEYTTTYNTGTINFEYKKGDQTQTITLKSDAGFTLNSDTYGQYKITSGIQGCYESSPCTLTYSSGLFGAKIETFGLGGPTLKDSQGNEIKLTAEQKELLNNVRLNAIDPKLESTKQPTVSQYNSQKFFANVERVLTEFQGLSYLPTLFMDDASLVKWRDNVDRTFATLYLGTEYWSSAICQCGLTNFNANGFRCVDLEAAEGIAYAETPQGLAQVAAHIEGVRTEPIIDETGKQTFIYKITLRVRNGDYEKDPRAPPRMNINVVLSGQRTVNLFRQEQTVNRGSSFSRTGTMAIVKESSTFYNQVCLRFDDVPSRWKIKGNQICNTIQQSGGAPTTLGGGGGGGASSGGGGGGGGAGEFNEI